MRCGRARDGAIGHSAVSGCTRRVCQNTAFRSSTEFLRKYDDLLRYFFSIRLLRRCNANVSRGCDMTQIRRYLLIGGEWTSDAHVNNPETGLNWMEPAVTDWTFPITPESGGTAFTWAKTVFGVD